MATLLRVDLSSGGVRRETVPPDVVERYVGGRGIGTKLLLQNQTAFTDASGICLFSTMAMPPEMLATMVSESLGLALDQREALEAGERIWNLERVFNLRAGFTRQDDALPARMLQEPLGEGMSAAHVVPLEGMLAEYCQLRGWDPEGRPLPEKLQALRV